MEQDKKASYDLAFVVFYFRQKGQSICCGYPIRKTRKKTRALNKKAETFF